MSSLPKKRLYFPAPSLCIQTHQNFARPAGGTSPTRAFNRNVLLGTHCWNVASHRRYVFCMGSRTAGSWFVEKYLQGPANAAHALSKSFSVEDCLLQEMPQHCAVLLQGP